MTQPKSHTWEFRRRIRALVAPEPPGGDHFVSQVLGRELELECDCRGRAAQQPPA